MKAHWLGRLARMIGLRRRAALPFRPAWFDEAYLSAPEPAAAPPPLRARGYNEQQRAGAWQKARPIIGWDPEDWRVDQAGNPIFRHHYGDPQSAFGWEVAPIAADGGDDLANLRPRLCRPMNSAWVRHEPVLDDRFAQ